MLEKYLVGKGIDVGKEHRIREAEYKYIDPSNLYLLRNEVGVEDYDYLYSQNFINETKYYRILLYEWFLVIREGGYIIIEFEDNEILDCSDLNREIASLVIYRDKHKIVEDRTEKKKKTIVIQKTKPVRTDPNEINQWTFGIVTNGKRKDFIDRAISSIRSLNIPQYEIVLCGTFQGEVAGDIRYIAFTENDDKGWITKKKNLICENARYENIAVIHDRIYFDESWFEGIKKWGNYFDVLSCPVMLSLKNGQIISSNWETVKDDFKLKDDYRLFHSNGILDVSDWDKNVIIPGPLIILKKHIWSCEKWNEHLFWGQGEDIEYSHRQHQKGIMIRLNSYSKAYASSVSGVTFNSYYEKDVRKLGKFHCELPVLLVYALKAMDSMGFRRNQKVVQFFTSKIKNFYHASSWKEERIR